MSDHIRSTNAINTHNMINYSNIEGFGLSERFNTRQRELSSTFFSSLPAPILAHKTHTSCLICLLLNGEIHRIFRDDSGRIEIERSLRLPLSKTLLTAGCFIPKSKGSIIICSASQSSLESDQHPVSFDSQISIYFHQKKQHTITIPNIVIRECISTSNYIVLLGHNGEIFFYSYMRGSLSLVSKFSSPHEFAIELIINYERVFNQRPFNTVCRLLMLNVATAPLSFASSSCLFLLYQNGALIVLSGISVILYALLQPHQPENSLTSSALYLDKRAIISKTQPLIKPLALSAASGYVFVGFANGILSIYDLDQIKNDMSQGVLSTQPLKSISTLEFYKNTSSLSTTVRIDDNKALHKGISALHPVYLWNKIDYQSWPKSHPHEEDHASIYLTELSSQVVPSTAQDIPGPFSHLNLCLLLSINNSTDVFLLKLFPQHELKLVLPHEGPSQLQMATVSVTQIVFLTNCGFTQTLYAQFSNGALFRLIIPTHIFFYSALKPPPPKRLPTSNVQEEKENNDNNTMNDIDSVPDMIDKPLSTIMQPSRHPLVSSTRKIKNMVVNSSAIIADLFPYGQHYSGSGKDASNQHLVDSLIVKKQQVSPLNVLLNDNNDIPPATPGSYLGQVARSLHSSQTGPSGPCFTNLLTHNSPLITQTMELNRSVAKSLERHADLTMSKAIPNEKIYHKVILAPTAPVRSQFVLNFLPTGNPIFRLLDGTVSKPKPIITQLNTLLQSSDICPKIAINNSNNTYTALVPKAPQSSTNKSTYLRPPSPSQLRRSHLLRVELPIPSAAIENIKSRKHHTSAYSSMVTRKAVNNSQVGEMLSMHTNINVGAKILPVTHKHGNFIDEPLFSDLESHELDTENPYADRCYTPFGPIESLSIYRHSDFCKKNGDLRLIYPHKRLTQGLEDSYSYNLNFSFQSDGTEQEVLTNTQPKNIWRGSIYSKRGHRVAPVQSLTNSHLYSSALTVSPAKLYVHDDNSRKRWFSKYFNVRRHGVYESSSSKSSHRGKRRQADSISFFVINLNDLFANPVARQILRVNVSSKSTSIQQPSLQTLLSDIPKKIGIEDTNRGLDEQIGYEIPDNYEERQPNLEQDRRLLTSKSGVWDTSTNMQNTNAVEDIIKPQESTGFPITPILHPLHPCLETGQTRESNNQIINAPIDSLDSVPILENLLAIESPRSDSCEHILPQSLEEKPGKHSGIVPISSQLHDPNILIDESGNLIMFSTPISPILSDVIKDGALKPIVDDMEEISRGSIDESLALNIHTVLRRNPLDSQENVDLGISLDLFPHNKMRISHKKYDLLSICTYRGPLPKLDDETKRFLEVMEQRSRYHLDVDDTGSSFMLTGPSASAKQTILENIEMYRQVIFTMTAQLKQANLEKDRIQQLYREIIRRILNNIDRLCEQDCIKKITLGKDKYYSLKRQCVVDYSSSSTESLLEEEGNSEEPFNIEYAQEQQDGLSKDLEKHKLCLDVEILEGITNNDSSSSDLTLDKLSTSAIRESVPDKEGQANNSFLTNTMSINDLSISNIDAKSLHSPTRIDTIADHSSDQTSGSIGDLFKDSLKTGNIPATKDSEQSPTSPSADIDIFEKDKYIGNDPSQRYIIHRDRAKVLFDIYAEDQEYSDTDPIYTEDNPKYVPIALTDEQYKVLFNLDAGISKRLRRSDISSLPSLYANTLDRHVEPQLWFMKTGYQFSPIEEDYASVDKEQKSYTLRNALSFQRVRTHLTLGDTSEYHSTEDMVSILTDALPDGENSEEACISEERSDDLNPDIFEDNINNIAYEDMTMEQKLVYLLNEPYVDATSLYLGKTLDELGYFMKMKKKERQQKHGGAEENIFDLMASGLGFTKPRMPDSYMSGEQIQKHKFDQAGGRLLSFTITPKHGGICGLSRAEPVDFVAANQFYQDLSSKQIVDDASGKEPNILVQDYKISHYYHNPLVNLLQCYYLVRNYAALNAYFSRHLILTDKIYTRSVSAPPWLGRKRKEQSILDLWEEMYSSASNKVLWDSTLALKRVSPIRKVNIDRTSSNLQSDNNILNLFRDEILANTRRYGDLLKNRKAVANPYIYTFFNTMRCKGIEYRQAIAEISKADLFSTKIANIFAKIYKIERLETEKHLKDLYDVANRTGNAKLYGLCINVMLFRPYLKKNPFKNVLAGVNSLVDDDYDYDDDDDDDASMGSNIIRNTASPRQQISDAITTKDLSEIFSRSSAATLLLELQEKRKKERREKKRARIIETNTKAMMFELREGTAVDISNIFIPFDMRFDYKDLRPGRCYFCAGIFIEIPFLPPYKFEKDNDLEEEFRGFVDKQIHRCKESKGTHIHAHSDEIEELAERASRIVNESVTLFDMKFLYTMYPVLYTNLTELLLSKRIKRMDANSDISDISKLIASFKHEGCPLEMDPLDPHIQEQQWKSAMSDSFCSLHASEIDDYETSKDQVATEVIAKVTDLDIYLSNSTIRDLDQAESPLRPLPSTKQSCQLEIVEGSDISIDKCDPQSTSSHPTPLAESGINITELSPDNRMLPTNYRNVMNLQTDYVFETNYKYYEHITIQSTINNKPYPLGLMPIKSVIRDILFECLASLPPFARFIAKKLIEHGNVFRAEELQMLPFVLLQAQLLYRPARDLFIYLRHAMRKIHLSEIQKTQRKAADEENLIPAFSRDNTALSDQDSIINDDKSGTNNSWRTLMYRPCSHLLDFDGLWGDKDAAINSNKRLFNYCALLLYHTRLAAGRTRQLMIWKLQQIAKRDKGGFQKGDAFAEVASKYNNIATSTAAHNNLIEAARFSMFYEDTLSNFSGIIAMGQRASPVIIYLRKIKDQFICLYDDFCLKSNKSDEYVANMRFPVLEEMRREAQIHVYAVLRIYGYKYMDDFLLGIQSHSLLLIYPLSLIVNLHTLYTISSNSISYMTMMRNKSATPTNDCSSIHSDSEHTTIKDLSSCYNTKKVYNFMVLLFMMFVKHHVNRMRPGYSFLIYVASELYHDITEVDLVYCLYNLTLFELNLRVDNSYVVQWPRLTALLGSFNAEMLAEWLEITFKAVYITTRNAAKRDVVNYLQKQQTMISALVSFVAHDQNTSCLTNTSMCFKGEPNVQTDSEEDEDFTTLPNAANIETHTDTGVTVPQELIEGMRRISSPTRHERIVKATDELLKMDRDQFITDDMLERVQQRGKFAAKIRKGNIDAIRADLDSRMNELKIILDGQEKSSNAADYEITEVREERQADEMGENFIEYAISKQLTEKLRVIRRDLSPTSFRTDESMDLVTPMRELREQCIKIESIKKQHELNEMMRLSSTESPQVENNLSSIIKSAENTAHKLTQNVNDIRIRGSSMSAWRNQIKHMLQDDLQKCSNAKHTLGNKAMVGDTCVRGTDYTLSSDFQLPSKIQGTVRRILTPQPGKTGCQSTIKQPATTIPRRPYSILGHIQSNPGKTKEMKKCSPPPPGSTVFSSDIQE